MIDKYEFLKTLKSFPEHRLFILITNLGSIIYHIDDALLSGISVEKNDILLVKSTREMMELCIIQTRKYGVNDLGMNLKGELHPSAKYWLWYNKWNDWRKKLISENKWNTVCQLDEKNEDIADYLKEKEK